MESLIYKKLLTIQEQLDVLKRKFSKLDKQTYPGEDIENVIKFMEDIYDQFEDKLNDYFINKVDLGELALFSKLINHFYKYVGCIINCDVKSHPREIMIPIKEILQQLDGEHIFITEPMWDLNYAVGPLMPKLYKDALEECKITIKNNLEVIRLLFPKLHQDNILLGAIMGHEIGHYIDLHYSTNLTEKIITDFMNVVDLTKYVKNYKNNSFVNSNDIMRIKAILPNVALRDWIKEIVADIIGVLIYGISSYLSAEHLSIFICDIDIKNEKLLQKFSPTHPRDNLRNHVRWMVLDKMGYFNFMDDKLKMKLEEYSKEWIKATTYSYQPQFYSIDTDEYYIINENHFHNLEDDIKINLENIIETILDELEQIEPNLIYNPLHFDTIIPQLVDKIIKIIPPNELEGKPMDSIDIINAGWVAYILNSDELKQNVNLTDDVDSNLEIKKIIDNLLKKAMLSANIHRRWNNVNNK